MADFQSFEIKKVNARQIIDSRGKPTVECDVITAEGKGRAAVPSGASRGRHEALELRDKGKKFLGASVTKAVRNIETKIAPCIKGVDCRDQERIDNSMIELDGTESKKNLGANAMLAVSLAVAKAAANSANVPLFTHLTERRTYVLPIPIMNLINGGAHAGNELAVQEFWILPIGARDFPEAIQMGCEIYYSLEDTLEKRFGRSATNVGDEGGFAPPLSKTDQTMEILTDVVEKSGYELGEEIFLGLDAAANDFYSQKEKQYKIDKKFLRGDEMIEFYKNLVSRYPIIAIEDPLYEEDFEGFSELTKKLGKKCLIVGDDIFVTNPYRLQQGVESGAGNSLILKVNQIGTLTETLEVVHMAKKADYKMIVSHRSGETTDTFISDLSVAINSGMIKAGAPARGERTCKYNRLLRIHEQLEKPKYPDISLFPKGE
ncbi:MAG: phosphopyruvate hydratase [Candidatus Korarchaeota archaeon]|nr:phosphopyruvate hydratase [Candidatus Korarchaeota archaeon]NIU82193.1 phosphopyruvate hydratase [Candidatus Thorarchaeota archaeon]NIW12666.1 phosphopyruvate hydratase [Candidatus Thorarchaeota archaeon]NIW50870.1 phosphopyruvate hydratase [Candidatus Korarchaeota archaeon]